MRSNISANPRPRQNAVKHFFLMLLVGLALGVCGCANTPPRNAAYDGGREFLFKVAGKLQRHGFDVRNIMEGQATNCSFMEFVAANGTLTIGIATNVTGAATNMNQRLAEFKELTETISGLAAHGLEVREFLYYPTKPHVVEYCDGRLIIRPPQKKSPSGTGKE